MASTTSTPDTAASGRLRDPYLLHRLHSLSGIVPIGIFLIQHLIANSYALRGEAAFNTVIAVYGYLPYVAILEITVIYIPLLYHAIYGFYIVAASQPNLGRYGYERNWMYFLQRISGVIAFFYIGFHVYYTSVQKYLLQWSGNPHSEAAISYQSMAMQMSHPLFFAIYIIGIIATVFHFTNGMWNFCIRWGITISPRSQRVTSYICWAVFLIFAGMGIGTANHFHNAGVNRQFASESTVIAQP